MFSNTVPPGLHVWMCDPNMCHENKLLLIGMCCKRSWSWNCSQDRWIFGSWISGFMGPRRTVSMGLIKVQLSQVAVLCAQCMSSLSPKSILFRKPRTSYFQLDLLCLYFWKGFAGAQVERVSHRVPWNKETKTSSTLEEKYYIKDFPFFKNYEYNINMKQSVKQILFRYRQ